MIRAFIYFLLISFLSSQNTLSTAKQYIQNNELEKAKDLLEDVLDDDDENQEAWFLIGKTFYLLNQFEESVDSFEEIIDDKTDNVELLIWYSKANEKYVHEASIFSRMSIAKTLLNTYKKILELKPDEINVEKRLIGFLLNAPGIAGGDEEEALKRLEKIKAKDPNYVHMTLFNYYLNDENPKQAELYLNLLEDSKEEIKNFHSLYNSYGYYLLRNNQNDKALKAFLKQIELAPNEANSYDSIGEYYMTVGNNQKAIESFKKALTIDPTFKASIDNLKKLEN